MNTKSSVPHIFRCQLMQNDLFYQLMTSYRGIEYQFVHHIFDIRLTSGTGLGSGPGVGWGLPLYPFTKIYSQGKKSRSHFDSLCHYSGVIMGAMATQITSISMVCSTVCSCAEKRKHQSSASQAFVRWIHGWQLNSPHKGPLTRKMFPLDDVIMYPTHHPTSAKL